MLLTEGAVAFVQTPAGRERAQLLANCDQLRSAQSCRRSGDQSQQIIRGAIIRACLPHLPSEIKRSRISQAKIVGFSRLYCSILETTVGVATFGLEPPIRPGGRRDPANNEAQRYADAKLSYGLWIMNTA